jgi:hypothetical protein
MDLNLKVETLATSLSVRQRLRRRRAAGAHMKRPRRSAATRRRPAPERQRLQPAASPPRGRAAEAVRAYGSVD